MPLFSQQRTTMRDPSQDEPQSPPPAGAGASTLFKRYRPLETRASGGFGRVEICLDSRLQRRVAIKRMPLSSGGADGSRETTAMALAEARTASMLQHPNIVQVIDFTYDSAYAYLVMEYVDGITLEEFLDGVDGHSLTFDEAACIADTLVQALSYAHENGVLHLDIKPANVLIDRSGHVKLTDFGMATLASSAGFGGARGGTIGYMPPEQLLGNEVDERTDIFALACVLYESLCAEAPFRASTPTESLRLIERGVTPPRELLPDLPERSEEALLQALSPDANDRMGSIAAFGDRFMGRLGNVREGRKSLARIIARLTSDDPEATVPQEQPEPERARKRRMWAVDPAEGLLGSRFPRAREVATGIVCGVSTAWATWWILGLMQVEGAAVRGVAAIAIGIAAGVAPQLGSALILAGFLVILADGISSVSDLPAAIVIFAVLVAWWYVWGRASPGASAVLSALVALACATGDALLLAPAASALAGYLLVPATAASSVALGMPASQLLLAAEASALTGETVAAALASPSLWVCTVVLAAAAAVESLALQSGWERYLDSGGRGLIVLACLVPLAACLLLLLLKWLFGATWASLMEIAGEVGAGILSSIMSSVCVYMLGYRRD